jgi:capsule polysaccharide export protein KpsE/RkpR
MSISQESDYSRVQRIEEAVIKLEKDMAVMSDAVTRTAKAVEVLADMRIENQLLRNDYEHLKDTCRGEVTEIKKELVTFSTELKTVRDVQKRNTMIADAGKWLGMTFIASGIAFIFWIIQTFGR